MIGVLENKKRKKFEEKGEEGYEGGPYDVVLGDRETTEGGGEAATTLISLIPCKTSSLIDNRSSIGVKRRSSFKKGDGCESSIICITFQKHLHF